MKTVLFVLIAAVALLTGCPAVAVKPTATNDQTAKNVQDLAAKVETMNGTLTQVSTTQNRIESTLNQITTTTTAQSGSTQAMAEKVGRDLENLSSSLGGKIGAVKGDLEQVVKNTTNTNNPWMVWGLMIGMGIGSLLILVLVIRMFMQYFKSQTKSRLLDIAVMDKGNDLDLDKLEALKEKAKGIL